MDKRTIKTVKMEKHGRFWAVRADGELLALVLYKKGALSPVTSKPASRGHFKTGHSEVRGS